MEIPLLLRAFNIFAIIVFVKCDPNSCQFDENVTKSYSINVDARGMGLCGVSPAPLLTIEHTQHHGECLASCAEFPGCFSYNFHYDSTECELFCYPEKYATIPHCFNYVQTNLICSKLGNPCMNGGLCRDGCMNYTCQCSPGYNGRYCEIDINECESYPCLNGATCNDLINGYKCTCSPGLTGMRCETNINECESCPCMNGATCNDLVNGYNCTCPPGLTGTRCETSLCHFPFTLSNNLYYNCDNGGCYIANRTWATCPGPAGYCSCYSVLDLTTNLTIPTFNATIPVISLNGWIVSQQRIDSSTDFNVGWNSYATGFGIYTGNFWMGLEQVYQLTKSGSCRARFEILNDLSEWLSLEYDQFYLEGASSFYRIHISGYTGDMPLDPMNHPSWPQNGQMFSAPGSDHDTCASWDCATSSQGGWWIACCQYICLNGPFNADMFGYYDAGQTGVVTPRWHWLKASRMMFKC